MKTLIPDDEIKQLINIIGGENNIKGIKLKLWSLYIVFNDFQRVDIEGVKALPLFSILSWVIVKLKLVAKIMNKIIICLIIL